jgi:hypothetical protein
MRRCRSILHLAAAAACGVRNLWAWDNPNRRDAPDLVDDEIEWVDSDTPTRIYVDGTKL